MGNGRDLNDIFTDFVLEVCALEQYVDCSEMNSNPIVDVVAIALRKTLTDFEDALATLNRGKH